MSIKANELRLGSILHAVTAVGYPRAVCKVLTITEMHIEVGYQLVGYGAAPNNPGIAALRCEDADPIPLTPEWLHKFGVTWNNINGSEYYFTTTGLDGLRLDPPTKGEDDGWTPMTPDGDGSIGKEIFFVHQLQNLFYSLTGEELTLKEIAW